MRTKISTLPKECNLTISFDRQTWDFAHEMAEDLSCSTAAYIRMLLKAEIARQADKEFTV